MNSNLHSDQSVSHSLLYEAMHRPAVTLPRHAVVASFEWRQRRLATRRTTVQASHAHAELHPAPTDLCCSRCVEYSRFRDLSPAGVLVPPRPTRIGVSIRDVIVLYGARHCDR